MSLLARIESILERDRLEDYLPYLAISESNVIYLEGGYLGAAWIADPMSGADQTTVLRLQGTLTGEYAEGTSISFHLVTSPYCDPKINHYLYRRYDNTRQTSVSSISREMAKRRAAFIMSGREKPLLDVNDLPLNDSYVLITFRTKSKSEMPDETVVEDFNNQAEKFAEALSTMGLVGHRLDAPEFLSVLRRMVFIDGENDVAYDDNQVLRDQVVGPGNAITIKKNGMAIGDMNCRLLSVKQFPRQASLAFMSYLTGDPGGINNQITVPSVMTATLYYPDQASRNAAVRTKAQAINYQAYGPMLRFIPILGAKKEGFDAMVTALDDGDMAVEFNLSLALYSRNESRLEKSIGTVKAYYNTFGFEMSEERHVIFPVWLNTLPMYATGRSIENLHRFRTMGVRHAVQFLPIIGEWQGTGYGATSLFVTRKGKPLLFDFYDSPTNYNGVLFAESGAGKSFATQQIICDYLSIGAKIWTIDVGHSYYKLAKILGGEFIEFTEESHACLNPFTDIKDIDEEADVLKAVLAKMAAPRDGLDDYRMAKLEEGIKSVWGRLGPNMTVTDVADFLNNQNDDRVRDLGAMLYPFTRYGSYGSWFDGPANLQFNSDFVVLELEALKARPHLQQVVLLQLVQKIQHEMFLSQSSEAGRKKLVIIDEAWSLMDDNGVAKFMENGYRRFRKYDGAALVVTQSINDFYNSPSGAAIAANSANLLIMQQKAESIAAIQENRRLDLGDYEFGLMRGVHTIRGKFSEIMLYTPHGLGIARLIVDRFSQVAYSTTGAERNDVLAAINDGEDPVEAIDRFIAQHG
jgi:conjugal transfer ATP-binding protein TraC